MPAKAEPFRSRDPRTPDASTRLVASIRTLIEDLTTLAPQGAAGDAACAAFAALLALPPRRLAPALGPAYEVFESACADHATDPDGAIDALRERIRTRHAELLALPAFAERIETPRRRANMLAWLLRENIGRLELLTNELSQQSAQAHALRGDLARLRAEREALNRELQRSRSLADVGLLTAGIAHDFNNLLQAISGYAALAHEGLADDDERRTAIEQTLLAAQRAAELTRRMMAWARSEPGVREPVDVSQLAAEVLDLVAPMAPPRALLARSFAAGLPFVSAEPSELRRIVLNLVFNAWQALGDEAGTVTVRTALATVPVKQVLLEVEDDGRGMDEATRARLFEPFFSTREEGYGLGLPLVRRIVDEAGGTLEVWSEPARGTRFRIALPAVAGAGATPLSGEA